MRKMLLAGVALAAIAAPTQAAVDGIGTFDITWDMGNPDPYQPPNIVHVGEEKYGFTGNPGGLLIS